MILFLKNEEGSCEPANDEFNWIREKVNILRNVQIGSLAPDFDLVALKDSVSGTSQPSLRLHQLNSDFTLLVFWASWCPHCTQVLPEIKKTSDRFLQQFKNLSMMTIAVSLDTNDIPWKKYVQENNLTTWINTSELKGWKGEVPKKYNVYATPTMILLDRSKKIIAKPDNPKELEKLLGLKATGQ